MRQFWLYKCMWIHLLVTKNLISKWLRCIRVYSSHAKVSPEAAEFRLLIGNQHFSRNLLQCSQEAGKTFYKDPHCHSKHRKDSVSEWGGRGSYMDALRCLSYLTMILCSHSDLLRDCIPHKNGSQLFKSGVSMLSLPLRISVFELSPVLLKCHSVLTADRLANTIGRLQLVWTLAMVPISSLFISLQFSFHPMQSSIEMSWFWSLFPIPGHHL